MIRASHAILFAALGMASCRALADDAATTLWSIGSPTDHEQYYLELINRARAFPAAEGVRLATTTDVDVRNHYNGYGVNLVLLQSEFAALPPRPPLAMNAKLIAAARGHSTDEYDNTFQDHWSSDRRRYIGDRISAAGYAFSNYGENTYTHATSAWFGHASFEADWGPGGTGGMQDGRKHRALVHSPDFKEIGIGIDPRSRGSLATAWGPVVTQDFAMPAGPPVPFVTGVAYHDLNGNLFYDPGEGIGGVTVNVSGAAYHSVTANSGGYAVPVPAGDAFRTVTFSGLGINTTASATITGTNNFKVDLKPLYSAPLVTGPAAPALGIDNIYAVTTVGGASRYDWRVVRKGVSGDPGIVTALPPGANLFAFVPATTGAWLLSARPVISGRTMAFGPATEVNAGTVIPPPSFALWAAGFELAATLPAGTLSANPAADHNGDGVPNLMAYALGLSPVAASARLLPQASVIQGNLRLDYSRDTSKADITLTPQVSTNLRTWFTPGQPGAPAGFSDTLLSTNGTVQSRRASVPVSPAGPAYLRLRVTKP